MEIEDAFTQEFIEHAGTDVHGDQETQLREVFQSIYENNDELSFPDGMVPLVENICLLFFVAGRAFQTDLGFPIMVSPSLVNRVVNVLLKEGS